MASQTQEVGADTSDQAVVAGVFSDHSAGMAALEKLQAMGAQLSEAGVTGVLILAKDADGGVDAQAAELSGAQFATIGIGPGPDVDAQPDAVKENLALPGRPERRLSPAIRLDVDP